MCPTNTPSLHIGTLARLLVSGLFSFHDPATPDIYTLSLHDALPIFVHQLTARREVDAEEVELRFDMARTDRKSTRLNSSHANISYAVFCLKKKNRGSALRPPAKAAA